MLATRTPLVIEDVHNDPRWSRDVAEDTGYVPKGLMAAPLLHEEGALGVLSVLDRPEQTLFSLQEMELLGLFANQAAIAVDLLLKAREAERLLGDGGGELEVVARLATAVDALEDEQREAGLRLLDHLARHARRIERGREAATTDGEAVASGLGRAVPLGNPALADQTGARACPGLKPLPLLRRYSTVGPSTVGPSTVGPSTTGP